jgi:hypothetical protein
VTYFPSDRLGRRIADARTEVDEELAPPILRPSGSKDVFSELRLCRHLLEQRSPHACGKVSGSILWANLHLLFWLSLVPFVTEWMGESHFGAALQRFMDSHFSCPGLILPPEMPGIQRRDAPL